MILPKKQQLEDAHTLALSIHGGDHGVLNLVSLNNFEIQMDYYYQYNNPSLLQMAAWLLLQIISQHYFIDGNKRTAFLVTNTFLELSGCSIDPSLEDNLYELTIEIAMGSISGLQNIENRLSLVYNC